MIDLFAGRQTLEKMKKTYIKPQVQTVNIESHRILCSSPFDEEWEPLEFGDIFG